MSAKPLLIMLSGKMKSGKSSLAERLKEVLREKFGPITVSLVSFATPLKFAAECLGIATQGDAKDRQGLQELAEYGLSRDVFTFVKQADKAVNSSFYLADLYRKIDMPPVVIIDDCRYPWELLYGVQRGYLTVRLDVTEEQQLSRGAEKDRMEHKSETSLDWEGINWDIKLGSDVTIDEAVRAVLGEAFRRFDWDWDIDEDLTISPSELVEPARCIDDPTFFVPVSRRIDPGLSLLADERLHQDRKHGAQLDLELETGHRYTMEEAAEAMIAYNKWQERVALVSGFLKNGGIAKGEDDIDLTLQREYLAELIDLGACCAKVLSSAVHQDILEDDFAKKRRGLK